MEKRRALGQFALASAAAISGITSIGDAASKAKSSDSNARRPGVTTILLRGRSICIEPRGCPRSPHRSHASRSQLGVVLEVKVLSDRAPVVVAGIERDLGGAHFDMARHVPDEAGQLAGDSDADLVLRQLSSHRKTAPALGQTQLRFPGDVADDFRLSFLPNLETSRDLSFEAIIPLGLHQDTPSMLIWRRAALQRFGGIAEKWRMPQPF
jgi:hypothetical protein